MPISLDKVAFDENSYLSVLNEDNEVIAHYNRFENQSSSVKSVRVFDVDKNLKFVLVPLITDNGYQIHIRDSNNSGGLVNITASIEGFKINYHSEVDYFGKPYGYKHSTRLGLGKVSLQESVLFNDAVVISNHSKVSAFSGIDASPLEVESEFYEENKMDVANWVLIIELLNELSLENSKYNNPRNSRQ